jgi:hypothetical protein
MADVYSSYNVSAIFIVAIYVHDGLSKSKTRNSNSNSPMKLFFQLPHNSDGRTAAVEDEINLDRRFSAEIRVLTGFHAYPENRFICKTGTEQHTTGPADFMENSGENRPGVYGHKIEINSSWSGV